MVRGCVVRYAVVSRDMELGCDMKVVKRAYCIIQRVGYLSGLIHTFFYGDVRKKEKETEKETQVFCFRGNYSIARSIAELGMAVYYSPILLF